MRFTAEVISEGRITIPKSVRDKLDINEGDFLELEIMEEIGEDNES